jgi:hypothetical protein
MIGGKSRLGPENADNLGPRVSLASQGLGQACPGKSGISYPRNPD